MIRTPEKWAIAVARNAEIARVSDLTGAVQITHGRYFWPLEPYHRGNDIDIEFIAHVLAGERRWGGILCDAAGDPSNYSVAQHSVHVADIANLNRHKLVPGWDWQNHPSPAFYALMHDASEAYLKDFPRPVKGLMKEYKPAEKALMDRILTVFGVPTDMPIFECVRRVDDMMIWMERDKLAGVPVAPYTNEFDHCRVRIDEVIPDFYVWDAKTAKRRFLEKFEEVVGYNGNKVPLEYVNRGYRL